MAWTATLLRLNKSHGRVHVEISYVDSADDERVDKSYQFERTTKTAIRALARREVVRLQEIKDEVIDIAVDDDIDLTPPPDDPPPPDPTPAEIAERAWFRDWRKLQTLLVLVDAQIIQPTDPRIDPLKVSLRAGLLNSYLGGVL